MRSSPSRDYKPMGLCAKVKRLLVDSLLSHRLARTIAQRLLLPKNEVRDLHLKLLLDLCATSHTVVPFHRPANLVPAPAGGSTQN